jgi:hypothetical protein
LRGTAVHTTLLLVALSGCSLDTAPTTEPCSAAETESCVCDDGTSGERACLANGSFGECDCARGHRAGQGGGSAAGDAGAGSGGEAGASGGSGEGGQAGGQAGTSGEGGDGGDGGQAGTSGESGGGGDGGSGGQAGTAGDGGSGGSGGAAGASGVGGNAGSAGDGGGSGGGGSPGSDLGIYETCIETSQCADGLTCGETGYCTESCGSDLDCDQAPGTGNPLVYCRVGLCQMTCGPLNACPSHMACAFPFDTNCRP